jgi:hypothetical protein
MNPRLSMPTTTSMFAVSKGTARAAIVERKPSLSRSSVVMSKKLMPALGKSGTLRTIDLSESVVSTSMSKRPCLIP